MSKYSEEQTALITAHIHGEDTSKWEVYLPASNTWHEVHTWVVGHVAGDPERFKVRRKPQTRTVTVPDFPEPVRGELEYGAYYYVPRPDLQHILYGSHIWENDAFDEWYMQRGLIQLTKDAAIAHARAMLALSGGEA